MLHNPSSFSNGANPNGYTPLEEQIHAFLANDDVQGFQKAFADKADWLNKWLHNWVCEHALHALENCPNTMAVWDGMVWEKIPAHAINRAYGMNNAHAMNGALATALGHALESLDEQAKCQLLRGQGVGPAQIRLGKHLQTPHAWLDVSPVWVGTPESDLRQAALALGWVPQTLTDQVARHMDHPDAARWLHLVPYPQTLVLETWVNERAFAIQRRPFHAQFDPSLFRSPPWIRPEDFALAQCIIAYSPVPLPIVLTGHPDVPALPLGEYESIERLVQLHAGAGLWEELLVAILHGHLPAFVAQDAIELPDLDGPTC